MNTAIFMRKAKMQLTNKWVNVAVASLVYIVLIGVATSIYVGGLIVGGPLTFGYILYIACCVDTGNSAFNLLFKGFDRFAETLVAGLIYYLAVFFGGLLLIVPGIILACGLSMTFYIMVDDPNVSGLDALQRSWTMMKGHKWDFFCLQWRFIGWALLCVLTCGIGYVFLYPYMTAANLNFYRQLRYGTF